MTFELSAEGLFRVLDGYVQQCGSQKNAAGDIGISPSYLNDILAKKRKIGPKVAAYFGYEPVVIYRKKET